MGYLDELKRQADEARARNTVGPRRRCSATRSLTDGACQAAFRYLASLAQPAQRAAAGVEGGWRFDAQEHLPQLDAAATSAADSRQRKKLRDAEVFDHVVLGFDRKTGTRVTIAKDFRPRSRSSRRA